MLMASGEGPRGEGRFGAGGKTVVVGVEMAEAGREGEAPVALSWRLERRVLRNAVDDY